MNSPKLHMRMSQRGFTLIELMIAVTIGLVLTVVVASLFLHSRSTYGSTDEISRMQENIRYSQQLLTRMVHHASYTSAGNSFKDVEEAPVGSAPFVVFDAVAQPALAVTNGGAAAPDTFTVRFQGSGNALGTADGSMTDCHGRAVAAGQMSVNTFSIAAGLNGGLALWCNSLLGGAAALNLEVVPDVENMQLVFGEDMVDGRDGSLRRDGSAERYLPATDIASANANKIVVLRVALLFATPNAATVVAEPNRTYDLNGVTVGPFVDKQIRRPVTMTLNLRNRYWSVYK